MVCMKIWTINCDMGENVGNDARLMPFLDECSIACGGHTGDAVSMNQTVALALEHDVSIGAHPSFPDPDNFGRMPMLIQPEVLESSLHEQIGSLMNVCRDHHTRITHIKPHGALYNLAIRDQATASVIVRMMESYPDVQLFAPWHSLVAKMAIDKGIKVRFEGFADRRYHEDLSLVARDHPDGVIQNPEVALAQVLSVVSNGQLMTIAKRHVPFQADTFCVHGDNPNALKIVKSLDQIKP